MFNARAKYNKVNLNRC